MADRQDSGRSLDRLKKDYLAYLGSKTDEIEEQKEARRYYHGAQWTAKQIRTFNRRRQPVVTYNRISRKINAVVGLLERQRQDPRAYPRTPKQEAGADIATAVLRYILDAQRWKEKSPQVGLDGGIDGIGGVEIVLTAGDQGDPDIGFEVVDPSSFFYDPRSLKDDFSDAGYMGIGKWADEDELAAQFPDQADAIRSASEGLGSELTSDPDSDIKWVQSDDGRRQVRVVDHWYQRGGEWWYCIYTGSVKLSEGRSYLIDEKDRDICKYVMYSANVDQDGDRYGFVRGMKSAQDEINQRRSKGLHLLNSRRMLIDRSMVPDGNIEKIREEAAKPDGIIEYQAIGDAKPEFDDAARNAELQGQLGFLADAKAEIENYGFNPALIGSDSGVASGRALQIQQQAGIAELGPYLLAYKGWKLRLYRALWSAAQQWWKAERWIRVTDDQNLAQFMALNQLQIHPHTAQPILVNALGSLDVDIIIDEGPDEINMQADAYDTLSVMAQKGAAVPPEVLIELSPLTGSVKQKVLDIIEKAQSNPLKQQAAMIELQGKQADTAKKMADAKLSAARAASEGQGDGGAAMANADLEWRKALLSAAVSIEVARIGAKSDTDSAAFEARLQALLDISGLANDQVMQLRDHAHQLALAQMQSQQQPQPAQNAA